MRSVEIDEAKADLARLVGQAARGEGFIIAEAGRPLVKVVRVEAMDAPVAPTETPEQTAKRRIGFMDGEGTIPDDIKAWRRDEIMEMFYAKL